ncbi:hypothetical protein ACQUSR_01900 [Streptomyces sp. P1-3]|uniref:hypothetical protein n=1 Tax=Streptomyces sp. P1-3 TaxID=3421658 RepID=UPI003D361728
MLCLRHDAASTQDRDAAVPLLQRLRDLYFSIRLVWADGGDASSLVDWAREKLHLTLDIVKRANDTAGFVVLPRSWGTNPASAGLRSTIRTSMRPVFHAGRDRCFGWDVPTS